MKLSEAIHGGWTALVHPGTYNQSQVVQPKTRQAHEPSQDFEYEKAKKRNKEQKKKDLEKYNDTETDQLTIYYDEQENKTQEKVKDMMTSLKSNSKKFGRNYEA